jgi:methylated-DNA-[protein]-cysteine S-methyltransferase
MIIDSPIGPLTIHEEDGSISSIVFWKKAAKSDAEMQVSKRCALQLHEYFTGKRTVFDLPLFNQGTAFQQSVWRVILKIPYGKTTTYKQIARKIGKPRAVRAVGTACGKNPWIIIVPCHRVVGADGLGGYAGGLKRKRMLLALEQAHV